jgi:hypothetical protein
MNGNPEFNEDFKKRLSKEVIYRIQILREK